MEKSKAIIISTIAIFINMLTVIAYVFQHIVLLNSAPDIYVSFVMQCIYFIGQAMVLLYNRLKKRTGSEKTLALKITVFVIPGIIIYGLITYIMATVSNLPYSWQLFITSIYSVLCYGIGVASMTKISKLYNSEKHRQSRNAKRQLKQI